MREAALVTDDMLDAAHWLEHLPEPDDALMTPEQARAKSRRWERSIPSLTGLADYPETIWQEELARLLSADRPPEGELFDGQGRAVDDAFWRALADARALPAPALQHVAVRYGFAAERMDVRTFPTAAGVFRAGQGERLDRLQETVWPVFEPLIILHGSRDGRFVYAQGRTYRGWASASAIAETDRETFRAHLAAFEQGRFVTILEPSAEVQLSSGEIRPADFAVRLPLAADDRNGAAWHEAGELHAVWWPVRDDAGRLSLARGAVAKRDACRGSLPCTRRSLVTQAFKLLGEPYGWGGACGLHDCSSFVMDVHRTVGLDLPRNADAQEAAPDVRAHRFSPEHDVRARISVLSAFHAGDVLYMPGHTMMLLGVRDGRAYVIHDYGGYAVPDGSGGWQDVAVQSVGVMPLDLRLSGGRQYIEALTSAVAFTADASLTDSGRRDS